MTAEPAPSAADKSYYEKGSVELAVETPVMSKRLETRHSLTHNADDHGAERLLIVLVGLPARGKSFIARKLLNYMLWRGNQCKIFNVGKYRRKVATQGLNSSQNADFFDDTNHTAARLRQEAAELALKETLKWLEEVEDSEEATFCSSESDLGLEAEEENDNPYYTGRLSYSERRKYHRIAIFDATNSTKERRQWILHECAKADQALGPRRRTGVLFLESICDDQELLQENFRVKISSCPDFNGMSEEEALQDLEKRIAKYESRYETIQNDDHPHQISYIKIFNLSSRLMVNHVYGRLAKVVMPAIMSWNTGSRPIYLIRAGETKAMEDYMKELEERQENRENLQSGEATKSKKKNNMDEFVKNRTQRKRSDRLGPRGIRFRDAVSDFIEKEGMEFMERKNQTVVHPGKVDTGTSIAGLRDEEHRPFEYQSFYWDEDEDSEPRHDQFLPFPCLVMSSTMPRAIDTATWKHPFPVKDVTNLNPLDMGDFAGMDLATIREQHPGWYKQLQREPFHTRFPGGESYGDLIDRLYSVIIDMEQQLGLGVVVSHVSVLQVLLSYFRSTPISKCMDIEVPMHTVIKFEPLRGGGWLESQHVLLEDGAELDNPRDESLTEPSPIWGDSRSCLPHRLDSNSQ